MREEPQRTMHEETSSGEEDAEAREEGNQEEPQSDQDNAEAEEE